MGCKGCSESCEGKQPNLFELWRLPHKACQRWEGLHLDGRSAEINVGLVSEAVSDADKVPLANQIARSRGRDLVSDDGFCSNVFQNLRRTQRVGILRGYSASSSCASAHLDSLYARVPLVHFLHSEKQDIVELIDAGVQDGLQPEDPPAPLRDLAVDDISVALSQAEDVQRLLQQSAGEDKST